jgi:hypothetical protein
LRPFLKVSQKTGIRKTTNGLNSCSCCIYP